MAIRILATIPDITPRPPEPKATRAPAPVVREEPTETPVRNRRAPMPRRPQPARRKPRAIFPAGSITVLAVIAAAIWSYVAIRDMGAAEKAKAEQRVAVETTTANTETKLR